MVEVIWGNATEHHDWGGGNPLIHIHHIERHIHGNAVVLKVFGEMRIAAKEVVFAKELKMNTIQVLTLTVEQGTHWPINVSKWIHHKGEYDNYASIDIICPYTTNDQYEMRSNTATLIPSTARLTALPYDGSIWLNFIALGE